MKQQRRTSDHTPTTKPRRPVRTDAVQQTGVRLATGQRAGAAVVAGGYGGRVTPVDPEQRAYVSASQWSCLNAVEHHRERCKLIASDGTGDPTLRPVGLGWQITRGGGARDRDQLRVRQRTAGKATYAFTAADSGSGLTVRR